MNNESLSDKLYNEAKSQLVNAGEKKITSCKKS